MGSQYCQSRHGILCRRRRRRRAQSASLAEKKRTARTPEQQQLGAGAADGTVARSSRFGTDADTLSQQSASLAATRTEQQQRGANGLAARSSRFGTDAVGWRRRRGLAA